MQLNELTDLQRKAAEQILALRNLSKQSNVITSRAQALVIRELNPVDLIAVADFLQQLKADASNPGGVQ
jgi:hypothetical protein